MGNKHRFARVGASLAAILHVPHMEPLVIDVGIMSYGHSALLICLRSNQCIVCIVDDLSGLQNVHIVLASCTAKP